MKTLYRSFLILALVALTAVPAIAGGGATVTHDHGVVTDWIVEDTFVCLGEEPGSISEVVDLNITYRWVWHLTLAPNGAYTIHYSDTNNGTGIGRTTGNRYDIHWNWHEQYNGQVGEVVQVNGTIVWRNLDTGQTQRNTYMVHITVNANGEVTAERVDPWPPEYTCLH